MELEPICKHCGRPPREISEYIEAAHEEGMSVNEYVKKNEGTYNKENGHFYCTSCYCYLGMPLGVAP